MGAAVASLLVLKWADQYPEWNVTGYGYATPCVVSYHLLARSEQLFITFVHHFDAVTRLSMGAIEDLHNGMRLFVSRLGSNVVAMLHAINKFTINMKKQKILQIVGEIDTTIEHNLKRELEGNQPAHLFPAGDTFRFGGDYRGNGFPPWGWYKR